MRIRTRRHTASLRSGAWSVLTCGVVVLAMVTVGCESTPKSAKSSQNNATSSGRQFGVDGESARLGEAAEPLIREDVFVTQINRLAAQTDEFNLRLWLAKYPDAAARLVVSPQAEKQQAAMVAALWLDQQARPLQGGWTMLIEDRKANPSRYTAYDRQKILLEQARNQGRFQDMVSNPLQPPRDAPSPWLQVNALEIQAKAALASGEPARAAEQFVQAANLAERWDKSQARKLQLFASLAYQAAGQFSKRNEFRNTALAGLDLKDVGDPMLLQLAIHTDDSRTRRGSITNVTTVSDSPTLRQLQARLGALLLQRGSPQAALLAWRAAESEPGVEPSTNQLRLKQAEALLVLRQTESAKAMLIGLAGQNSDVRPQALAMLGLLYVQGDQVRAGFAMLREAVEVTTPMSHPQIYADAGLALMAAGNANKGLQLLRQARDGYIQRGDQQGLYQTLQNELVYAQHQGQSEQVAQLRQQLTAIQRPTTP